MNEKKMPVWKRILDVTCVVASAPVVIPLAASVAAYIKLTSKGPVIFKQERIGLNCNKFTCYKFRSMQSNAAVTLHKDHVKRLIHSNLTFSKIDRNDPRLIPGAKLLRLTGLDELPQLWNVLKGEMSLVGPRPCVPYEFEQFQDWHKERFSTLPGLTGLWQVNGKNKTTFQKMMDLDIRYARTLSPLNDIKIILKTIPAILNQAIGKMPNNTKEKMAGKNVPATV